VSVTVPELGAMIDISTFAVQDMLVALGFRVDRGGVWNQTTQKALSTWNGRQMPVTPLTVIPKEGGQTVSITASILDTLRTQASEAARLELARRQAAPAMAGWA
jgi:hypothetical protein